MSTNGNSGPGPSVSGVSIVSWSLLFLTILFTGFFSLQVLRNTPTMVAVLEDFDAKIPTISLVVLNLVQPVVFIPVMAIFTMALVAKELLVKNKVATLTVNNVALALVFVSFGIYREAMILPLIEIIRALT